MDQAAKWRRLEGNRQRVRAVGFEGAGGTTGVTHVAVWRLPPSHSRVYTGKEGFPTLADEATVDHAMRVRAVTKGYPGP